MDVKLVRPGGPLGPAMDGVPVRVVEAGTVEAGGVRYAVGPLDLIPARLWIGRGLDWQGPHRRPDDALAGLPGDVADRLRPGLATPLGAACIVAGWRYRLAWGGEEPPGRFTVC